MKWFSHIYQLDSEDIRMAWDFAERDHVYALANLGKNGNSHDCISEGLGERFLGQSGEIAYRRLCGYPIEYHHPQAVDVSEENTEIRTRRDVHLNLYIRDLNSPEREWVLMVPYWSRGIQHVYEFKGWATVDMFRTLGRWTDYNNGRPPCCELEQNQLLSPDTKRHR